MVGVVLQWRWSVGVGFAGNQEDKSVERVVWSERRESELMKMRREEEPSIRNLRNGFLCRQD